ncbi:MAG: FxLYD domain-containing protein, partial [Pseudomonadota bacterium]|nr:FxLYD domain-containing protein [Pseudomonadota bacterium]
IYEPKTFLDIKKEKKVLGITGQIMNETGKPIEIPLLKAILLGSKGENVKSWTFKVKQPRIDPGEKVEYETSLANPPTGATGLQITFTRVEEEMMDDKMKALDAK